MGWRLRSRTQLDFTLAEMRTVEDAAGLSWWLLDPCAVLGHARAVLALEMTNREVDALPLGELGQLFQSVDGDDLPNEFEDGMPVDGERLRHDRWVVWAAYSFRWPPDVTERQTERNLQLLAAADPGED